MLKAAYILVIGSAYWQICDGANGDFDPSKIPWGLPAKKTLKIPVVIPLTMHGCGPSRYMSMRIAAEHINNQDSTVAPAIAALVNKFQVELDVMDNEKTSTGSLDTINKLFQRIGKDNVKVIIGPNGSGACKASSPYLNVYGVSQMAWAATSSDLSNKDKYPNFWRVAAPDKQRMHAMALFIDFCGFSSFHIIHADDSYTSGEKDDMVNAVTLLKTQNKELQIIQSLALQVSKSGFEPSVIPLVIEALKQIQRSIVRVVVGLAMSDASLTLFKEAHTLGMLSKRWVWFGTDGLNGNQIKTVGEDEKYFTGALFLIGSSKGPLFDKYEGKWKALMPTAVVPEFETQDWVCKTPGSFCKDHADFIGWTVEKKADLSNCDGYTALAYDAVLTLAVVADDIMQDKSKSDPDTITKEEWDEGLKKLLDKDTFHGLSGPLMFNKFQERANSFEIKNWDQNTGNGVAVWDIKRGFVWKVGAKLYWPGFSSVDVTKTSYSTPPFPAGESSQSMGEPAPCAKGSMFDTSTGVCVQCSFGEYDPRADFNTIGTKCDKCLPGEYQDKAGEITCKTCTSGWFAPEGTKVCESCPPATKAVAGARCDECEAGRVNSQVAKTTCKNCEPGTFAEKGKETCTDCGKGTVAESAGAGSCTPCAPGSFASDPRQQKCTFCAPGFYQSKSGEIECLSCVDILKGSTTERLGAQSAAECVCPEGEFRRGTDSTKCEPCPDGLACEIGSDMRNFASAKDEGFATHKEQKYPALLPSHWSSPDEPLEIFKCANEETCTGGKHWNEVCQTGATGRSCGECIEDWSYDGQKCVECTDLETSKVLFPALPIILSPTIICFLYFMFRDMPEKWGNWKNGIAALNYLILSHYQMISLISSVPLKMPVTMSKTWKVWGYSQDVISLFAPACAGFSGFKGTFITQSFVPIVLMVICILTWLGSKAVGLMGHPHLVMDADRMINLYFSIIFAFFIGIASASMSLFKCQQNPSAPKTLVQDLSIICGSDEWNSVLVFAVFCIVVYCIGCGALYSFIIAIAPRKFNDVSFQKRWKFLFIKYSSNCFWWSIPILAKGVFLNLGFVMIPHPIGQIYWLIFITFFYLTGLFVANPWRHQVANVLDALVHLSVICLLSISALYADRTDQESTDVSVFGITVSVMPMIIFGLCIAFLVKDNFLLEFYPDIHEFLVERTMTQQYRAFNTAGELQSTEVRRVMASLDDNERKIMNAAVAVITDELIRKSAARLSPGLNFELGNMAKKRAEDGGLPAEVDSTTDTIKSDKPKNVVDM